MKEVLRRGMECLPAPLPMLAQDSLRYLRYPQIRRERRMRRHILAKLPLSGRVALTFPFASPTGYGLGKSGWVSARFGDADDIPLRMLEEWIDESFRAVAPKKVVARLDAAGADGAPETNGRPAPPKPKRRRKS